MASNPISSQSKNEVFRFDRVLRNLGFDFPLNTSSVMRFLAMVFTVTALSAFPLNHSSGADTLDAAVESYEHLSIVLVEVRRTEDAVVKTIITHHYHAALEHLKLANKEASKKHLEAAAEEITNVANEGDKRVLAIRQRLAKAGSTHLTDEVTKEDYLWINSAEKKSLLETAKAVAKLDGTDKAELAAVTEELEKQFAKAIEPEKR